MNTSRVDPTPTPQRPHSSIIWRSINGVRHVLSCIILIFLSVIYVLFAQIVISGMWYRLPAAGIIMVACGIGLICYAAYGVIRKRRGVSTLTSKTRIAVVYSALLTGFLAGLLYINTVGPSVLAQSLGAAPGQFLILGILGVVICGLCVWGRAWRSSVFIGLSSIIMVLGAATVLAAQSDYATSIDVPLSTAQKLSQEYPTLQKPTQTVQYAVQGGQPLSAAIWADSNSKSGKRPAVVLIHGGGFASGAPIDMINTADILYKKGYVVFSIEYRLAPPARWKDATDDVVTFMQWLRVNADSYGVDPAKVVMAGNSAGGGLALNATYGLQSGKIEPNPALAEPINIAGVIGLYPAVDLSALYDSTEFQNPQPVLSLYGGGSPEQVPGNWAYADPMNKITGSMTPTLLITGANDHLVYSDTVSRFATKARNMGTPVEFHVIPYADHSYDIRRNSPATAIQQAVMTRWMDTIFQ